MARVKRGVIKRRRHKKILKLAKGYKLGRSKLFRQAQEAVIHAGADAYKGRKEKKRQMRSLWITRLSAALKSHGLSYSKFINLLKIKNIELDRKILSEIAKDDPGTFTQIIKIAQD
jgi:large subunit ribosomal protein L20